LIDARWLALAADFQHARRGLGIDQEPIHGLERGFEAAASFSGGGDHRGGFGADHVCVGVAGFAAGIE